jgi:PAS domain S-box-containing protein
MSGRDILAPPTAGPSSGLINVTGGDSDIGPLQDTPDELADFFENAAVALHIVGNDGIIQRANRAELQLLGYSAEEYIGRHIGDFHADADVCATILAQVSAGQQINKFHARLRAKDGSIKHVLITSNAQMRSGRLLNTRCFTIDVTDWMAAEAALRAQDRRLAVTYEQATVAIVEVDAEGRRLRVNEMACRLTGRPRTELLGRCFYETFDPEESEREQASFRQLVAGSVDQYVNERRIVRGDGTAVWVTIRCSAVREDGGKFLYAVRIMDDITSAKLATEALAESEQRRAATYEHAGLAIVEVDAQGRLLRVNEATCTITGFSREELLGRTVFDVTHPGDSDWQAFQRQVEDPATPYTVEKRIVRKDGRVAWVSVTSSSVRDGHGRFRYGVRVMQDITERKEAERLRRDTERQLRDLIEALPAAVYTTDAKGRVTYYNQAAVELSGRVPELGADQWCVTWQLYRPDGTPLPHDECPMAIALKEGRAIRNVEAVAERPDGTRVPFIPFPTPLRNDAGELVGAVNMLIDISERKQAETRQRVLLDELNHRVKNNMQMLHSLLWGAQRETQNPEARAVLADAGRRVAAMAAAQQTLYDARRPATFDAQQFLESVCGSAQQGFPKNVRVIRESASGQLSNDSAIPLALILNELLTNAVKHGVNGREQGTVRVGLLQSSSSCELYVEDDGLGFDLPEIRRRSSGIGLVIGLARQLGGTLEVQKTPCRCTVRFQTIAS